MKRKFVLSLLLTLSLVLPLAVSPALAQDTAELDPDAMEQAFVEAFNGVIRQTFNARALARNAILDEVAQSIADAVGCTEDPVSFDVRTDAESAGYALFPGDNRVRTTQFALLPSVNERPIQELAQLYGQDIFETSIAVQGRRYREIGVGVSPCNVDLGASAVGSTQQYALFIVLGSQPDVIPVVIENGETTLTADSAPLSVTLSIHQENSRQRDGIFGRGSTMKISDAPIDADTESVPYAPTMAFELQSCGENTVYYEIADRAGLAASGEVSVTVECASE